MEILEPNIDNLKGTMDNAIPIEPSKPEKQEVGVSNPDTDEDKDMAETKNLLNSLKDGLPSIPGLDIESIVNRYIEKSKSIQETLQPYKDLISSTNDQSEKSKYEENLKAQLEIYKKQYTEQFNNDITNIKIKYKSITEGVTKLTKAIGQFVSGMAIPKVITTGTAVSVPNPATAIIEALQFKSQCEVMLNNIISDGMSLLESCMKIHFPVPSVVVSAIMSISNLTKVINSIPG